MTPRTAAQMRHAKTKGRDAENAVVEWLKANGRPHAERRRLTGSSDQGDIAGLPYVVVEVKNEKTITLPGYLAELEAEIRNAKADTGVVLVKRRGSTNVADWYAVMPGDRWLTLLTEAGR